MSASAVIGAIGIAVIGWLATLAALRRGRWSRAVQRLFVIPAWVPCLALALGAPILQGRLAIVDALSAGSAVTMAFWWQLL